MIARRCWASGDAHRDNRRRSRLPISHPPSTREKRRKTKETFRHKPTKSLWTLNSDFAGIFVFKRLTAISFRAFHACAVSINKPQVPDGESVGLRAGVGAANSSDRDESSKRRSSRWARVGHGAASGISPSEGRNLGKALVAGPGTKVALPLSLGRLDIRSQLSRNST